MKKLKNFLVVQCEGQGLERGLKSLYTRAACEEAPRCEPANQSTPITGPFLTSGTGVRRSLPGNVQGGTLTWGRGRITWVWKRFLSFLRLRRGCLQVTGQEGVRPLRGRGFLDQNTVS